MADIYDIDKGVILRSQNTPKFLKPDGTPKAGYIISPDRSAVAGTPQKYWKLSGQSLVPMSQAEKDAVDAAEVAEEGVRATKGAKEAKIAKGTRLAAIAALLSNGDITQAKHDTWVAKENE